MHDDIERNDVQIIAQDDSVQRKYLAEGVRRIEIKVNNFKIDREFQGFKMHYSTLKCLVRLFSI